MEVNVGDFLGNFSLEIIVAVSLSPHHHVLETHVVAGQSASLVRKHVLDLTQFLVERAGLDSDLRWLGGQEVAVADVDALEVLHHFEGDDHGDGDEVGEEEDPAAPLHEQFLGVVDVVPLRNPPLLVLDGDEGAQEGDAHLHHEDVDDDQTHLEL